MYNFEVEDNHTYFVSCINVLVHNHAKNCGTKKKTVKKDDHEGKRPTSKASFREAKRKAGIPTSAQYVSHKFIYDGSSEHRTVYTFIVNGKKKYIVKHAHDKMRRGAHYHTIKKGNPLKKDRYKQGKGHYPEDKRGFR